MVSRTDELEAVITLSSFTFIFSFTRLCSFLLATGKISGPNEFTPTDAIILQNKDEVLIPLLTTVLPSAKEFRDAIQSLSPEQARFAKSYRAMQLDSSVFGVLVVQVKPQMEALLDLPPTALTKEIQLTQDLLSLFVEYQIPPNLVSYDGDVAATASEKVIVVKQHVKGVLDVIAGIKSSQLEEERKKADMRLEQELAVKRREEYDGCQRSLQAASVERETMRVQARCAPAPELGILRPMTAPARPPGGFSFGAASSSAVPQAMSLDCARSEHTFASPAAFSSAPVQADQACAQPESAGRSNEANNAIDVAEGFDILQDHFSDLDLAAKSEGEQQTDFTTIPKHLDQMFESFDKDGALRTMTIKTGDQWTRKRQENLLTKLVSTTMSADAKKQETNKALDLLDALSRSGSLPIASGELHVVIGVRHTFEKAVMATVVEDNINPVEKVDYSSLLMASTVHQVDIPTLLADSLEPPLLVLKNRQFPALMMDEAEDEEDSIVDGET